MTDFLKLGPWDVRTPARLGLLRPSRDAVGYAPALDLPEVIGVPLSTFADALKRRDD